MGMLWGLFLVLNFLDALTTTVLYHYWGPEVELNPLLRTMLIHANSAWPLWAWKAVVCAFLLSVTVASWKSHRHVWYAVMIMSNAMLAVIVAWGTYLTLQTGVY